MEPTTISIRSFPRKMLVQQILQLLELVVPDAAYNFVLMPMHTRRANTNLGQCIVNFVSSEAAMHCKTRFAADAYHLDPEGPSFRIAAVDSLVQGLRENLAVCAVNFHYKLLLGGTENLQEPLVFDRHRTEVPWKDAFCSICSFVDFQKAWASYEEVGRIRVGSWRALRITEERLFGNPAGGRARPALPPGEMFVPTPRFLSTRQPTGSGMYRESREPAEHLHL